MSINYITIPKPKDVKVARIYLEWNQETLARKCGVNIYAINSLETGRHNPTKETLEKIASVFLKKGIRFHPGGGFICDKQIVKVYEGEDCYSEVQEDILKICFVNKEEALFLGVDDKKSKSAIIEKERRIYKAGIPCKYLMSSKKNYAIGPLEDYRMIDDEYFLSQDLIVIYGMKIAFASMIDKSGKAGKIIVLEDDGITNQFKKYFYRLWKKGEPIKKSTAKQSIFKV